MPRRRTWVIKTIHERAGRGVSRARVYLKCTISSLWSRAAENIAAHGCVQARCLRIYHTPVSSHALIPLPIHECLPAKAIQTPGIIHPSIHRRPETGRCVSSAKNTPHKVTPQNAVVVVNSIPPVPMHQNETQTPTHGQDRQNPSLLPTRQKRGTVSRRP